MTCGKGRVSDYRKPRGDRRRRTFPGSTRSEPRAGSRLGGLALPSRLRPMDVCQVHVRRFDDLASRIDRSLKRAPSSGDVSQNSTALSILPNRIRALSRVPNELTSANRSATRQSGSRVPPRRFNVTPDSEGQPYAERLRGGLFQDRECRSNSHDSPIHRKSGRDHHWFRRHFALRWRLTASYGRGDEERRTKARAFAPSSFGRRGIRTCDFHCVRTTLASEPRCFSGSAMFKDCKNCRTSQGFPEGKTVC
jgi:hypothetical protein